MFKSENTLLSGVIDDSIQPGLVPKETMIKSPVLKYYGSKFRLAKWIIEHFPKHRHYVEPFGGGASVLLLKEPAILETYNDLNGDIVNFFRVLRECPEKLIQQLELTPWARSEYESCLDNSDAPDSVEAARRLYCRLWMSIHGGMVPSKAAFRRHKHRRRSVTKDSRPQHLFDAAQRLRSVVIENRDAFKLISETDSANTLFYLDPPYIGSTRTNKNMYSHEMTDEKHYEFAELLYNLKGFVVLSGYSSPLYFELFEKHGWTRIDKKTTVNGSAARIESLWLSPSIKL